MREPRDLEGELAALGASYEWPEQRDLVPGVRARLAAGPARRAWWRPAALAPALGAALLVIGTALALSPDARATAAEVLRLRGIDIFRVTATPSPAPSPVALVPGTRVTLAQARATVPFPLRVPGAPLGEPDEITVTDGADVQVYFVYRERAGIRRSPAGVAALVTQLRGSIEAAILGKAVGPGTTVEPVTVNGAQGYWITGAPHYFFYRDARGNVREESLRLAGNVLLWEQDGVTLRIEADVSKEDALRVAASMR